MTKTGKYVVILQRKAARQRNSAKETAEKEEKR